MGAQETFLRRETNREQQDKNAARVGTKEILPTTKPAPHTTSLTNSVSFPYEFPSAGRYRLWVQMKSEGRVFTGVFEAEVRP